MKTIKKRLAVALTVALLAFPLSTAIAMAETVTADQTTIVAYEVTTDTAAAEAAVAAYEVAPLTTLEEVATAEGLKAAADTAVEAVVDVDAKTAFVLRVTNQTTAITTAKAKLTPIVDDNGDTVTPATWFTDLIAKLQLALAFDPARKSELNERHALTKLAKAQKLMIDGNNEAAEIYLNQYTDKIAKAQAFLEQVEDPTSEAAITLQKALVNVNSNNIQVLSNLIDKLPPQAAQRLALNVVRSMEKAVQKMEKAEAKVAIETTPETTLETDHKILEMQTKVALENFKKSLIQKGKVHLDDLDQDQHDVDKNVAKQSKPKQEKPEMKQNLENQSQGNKAKDNSVNKQTPPTNRYENNKNDQDKQVDRIQVNGRSGGDDNRRDDR